MTLQDIGTGGHETWPGPDRGAALLDFWAVYEHSHEAMSAETLPIFAKHPVFGPLMASMPPGVQEAQARDSHDRLRLAMHGDWAPYEANLRTQGVIYARLGIQFRDWYEIVRTVMRFMTPRLVRAYIATPERLADVLSVTQDFLDAAMSLIAEAYLDAKEAAIRDSEQQLATTLDSIGDAVIATDLQSRIVRMNPVAERLTGWRLEDARGLPLTTVFHIRNEETDELVESPADRVLSEGIVVGLANHTVLVAKDGTRRPIADSGAPIRTASGQMTGVVLVFRDMTDEHGYALSLRKWEQVFHHAGWGAALVSGDTSRFEAVNPAYAAMHGYTVEELLALPPSALTLPGARLDPEQIATLLAPGVKPSIESLHVRKDGTSFPVLVTVAPIRDDHGGVRALALNVQDITEQRQLEGERTRAVVLKAENARILEASRLKSEFLANMSHELRTPLNAIIGFTELIHDGEVTPDMPEFKSFLGDVLASAQHLLKLINDVLDLSKVEAGKLDFSPEHVDLHQLVGEVVAILRSPAHLKDIQVEARIDPTLSTVLIDPARLKQVLYNFMSNALKFTEARGRVIVRVEPEAEDSFRLEVEDTGVGIEPQDLSRLFVEFQQLDAGAAKRHGGTGLGLALTRRLVEAQGGSVGVRSARGAGSTFHAVLPRWASGGVETPLPRSYAGADRSAPVILVVEDNRGDRSALVDALVAEGFAVEVAATGAQACRMSEDRSYAAITLDLVLPDTSGLAVLRHIRANSRHHDVPVLVVTMVAEKSALAGFAVHDILAKPLDAPALLASLRRAGVTAGATGDVLVVDDDPSSLRLMAATLAQLGYPARCVTSGEAGLQAAAHAPPAAIILDLLMPEMDGFTFLQEIRKIPSCRRTPVIVWTVKDLTQREYGALRAAAEGIMLKGRASNADVLAELRTFLPPRAARGPR